MKRMFLIILSLIFFQSCEKDDFCNCLESEGNSYTEIRSLEDFDIIELNNNVDVILTPDTFSYAELTCGKNLADGIKTEIENGMLFIRNNNRCNWLRDFNNKFTLNVHFKNLKQIVYNGSGNIECSDTLRLNTLLVESWNGTGNLSFLFHGDELYLKLHTGPADMQAAGIAGLLYVYTAGNGYIRSGSLIADQVVLTSKSTGDCEVYATGLLDVSINYNGDVFYHGNPATIRANITGSGKLYPF